MLKGLCAVMALGPALLQAQDTVALGTVEVRSLKTGLARTGKKVEAMDSTVRELFRFNSIAELLSLNSPVFVKSYGPGNIATTAFRGGNAAHTAVTWNGFNIQNSMLGETDLSLLPSSLFDRIEVEYGGSSSLWGSGAVAGSIHLGNRSPFGQGLTARVSFGMGSFGLFNGSSAVLISRRRFVSSTKIYAINAANNYRYRDTLDPEQPIKRLENAAYYMSGLLQEFRYLINSRQTLALSAWVSRNSRRLPNFIPGAPSKTWQFDEAARFSGDWSYTRSRFRSALRAGFFNDRIDFTDSLALSFSKSRVRTFSAESESYFSWLRGQQFNIGLSYNTSSALTENYASEKSLSRASLLAGNKSSFLKERLVTYVSARAEYFSVGRLPLTGGLSGEYRLANTLTLTANAARVYRQPTLNQLYWVPGGNPGLLPEQGYTYEGDVRYRKTTERFVIAVSGAAFSRLLHNWILWVPGPNGNPTPLNIQTVWSRGTETTWLLGWQPGKWKLQARAVTGYVLSTVQANGQQGNSSLGRQLIYTPRYTANGSLAVGYGQVSITYFHQYIGYRFSTSDNLQWLDPYHLSSLRLNATLDRVDGRVSFFAAVNNLFNNNYAILAGRPMPLRSAEIGITLQTKPKNNTTDNN